MWVGDLAAQKPEDVDQVSTGGLEDLEITTMPYEGKPEAMGMTATEVVGAVSSLTAALSDPFLPEGMCRIKQLYEVSTGRTVSVCVKTPMTRTGGIGIKKAIYPLRAVVYAEQHRWVYPAAVAAAVGIPFLLGYLFGRKG